MSSRSKLVRAPVALELIFDYDSEIQEDVSEYEEHLKVNSESDDSD